MNQETTPLQELARTVEELPIYLFKLVVGLLVAILSNPLITVLALGTAAACVAFNVWAVLGIAAMVYVEIFTLNAVGNSIASSNSTVARSIYQVGWERSQPPSDHASVT